MATGTHRPMMGVSKCVSIDSSIGFGYNRYEGSTQNKRSVDLLAETWAFNIPNASNRGRIGSTCPSQVVAILRRCSLIQVPIIRRFSVEFSTELWLCFHWLVPVLCG